MTSWPSETPPVRHLRFLTPSMQKPWASLSSLGVKALSARNRAMGWKGLRGLRASARGHGPESTPRTQNQELCPLDSSCPGKDHGMVWSPRGQRACVLWPPRLHLSQLPWPSHLSCSEEGLVHFKPSRCWGTSSKGVSTGQWERALHRLGRRPTEARASQTRTADRYHTRCPHQLETDGPQCWNYLKNPPRWP